VSNALKTLKLLVDELEIPELDDDERGLFLFAEASRELAERFKLLHWHPHRNRFEALKLSEVLQKLWRGNIRLCFFCPVNPKRKH